MNWTRPMAGRPARLLTCLLAGFLATLLTLQATGPAQAKSPTRKAPSGSVERTLPFTARGTRQALPQGSPPATRATQVLFADDFEGSFPGSSWTVTATGTQQWGRWNCWASSGSYSVGSAAAGSAAISCGENYGDNQTTWMIAGPFSLADSEIESAAFSCNVVLNTEEDYDTFYMGVSTDGSSFNGYFYSGTSSGTPSMDLADLLGQNQVWIGFQFYSDSLIYTTNGAQIDDVMITAETTGAANQAPSVTVTAPNGGELLTAGAARTITYTASDPDGGPGTLTVGIDYSDDAGASWSTVATGQSNTGSYAWTVPAATTTQGQIRVTVSDGADTDSDTSDGVFAIVDQSNSLALGQVSGPAGTSVLVPLSLDNESVVKGLQLDVAFSADVVSFGGATATGRAVGMQAEAALVSAGRARVLLFFDDAGQLAAGSGAVANLSFDLIGTGGSQSNLTIMDGLLSGPEAESLPMNTTNGRVDLEMSTEPPTLHLSVLRNPGRPRSLQILVSVANGSGAAPVVVAGGNSVAMTTLGGGLYMGTAHLAGSVNSATITATDTNPNGTGNDQVALTF